MSLPGDMDRRGATSISLLVGGVFLIGVAIAAFTLYSAFVVYRANAIRDMARDDAKMVSELVFENLFLVMRKGWTRTEIDDVIHHIRLKLPDHEVLVVRGEPVVRQYGDRENHARLRTDDPLVVRTFSAGEAQAHSDGKWMRYAYPVIMANECVQCHTAHPGEVNGVITVSVPLSVMEVPIENMIHPMLRLGLLLVLGLLLATYLILRARVVVPMQNLGEQVGAITSSADYSRDLVAKMAWPRELHGLADNFNALMGQVRLSTDALRDSSLRDPLTNLFNRRHFDAMLEQAARDSRAGSAPFALLLIDLDRFKPVNDLFGHAAGDAVLMSVARAIQDNLRSTDLAARIGGDEFVVLALSTTRGEAEALAYRLREAIRAPALRFGQETLHVDCSIGVATYPDDGDLGVDVLRAADAAMYADKAGRNEIRQSVRDG